MAMITQEELRQRFIRVRRDRKLSLCKISNFTGVSMSTLSCFENDRHALDSDNLFAIAHWLGVKLDTKTMKYETVDTFEGIERTLRNDQSLTTEGRNALMALMQAAYKSVTQLCFH